MKKLEINNSVFDLLRIDPSINRQALQRLMNIANTNPELNSYFFQAASNPKLQLRLGTNEELKKHGAGAFFDRKPSSNKK